MTEQLTTRIEQARRAYGYYQRYNSAKDAYEAVKNIVDADTRRGTIFREGIKRSLDLAGRILGASLTKHPYFTYHRTHIDALSQALNVSAMHDRAANARQAATSMAREAQILQSESSKYDATRKGLIFQYMLMVESIRLFNQHQIEPERTERELQRLGATLDGITRTGYDLVGPWQGNWAELVEKALALLFMVELEVRGAERMMDAFENTTNSLQNDGNGFFRRNLGVIAASGLRQQQDLHRLDHMRSPNNPELAALADPVAASRRALDVVDRTARRVVACSDLAWSTDAYRNPDRTLRELGAADQR